MQDDDIATAARLTRAIEVVRDAGALALDYYKNRDRLTIEKKGRQDLVSAADRAVEVLIREQLGRSFAEDGYVGEEGGGEATGSCWVIDPIDGTHNFLRGLPFWAVTVAYVRDGRTEIGLTFDPVHDEMYAARRGHGATRNGVPIRVSSETDPASASVALSFNMKTQSDAYLSMLGQLIGEGFEHRRIGSTAIKLVFVADGRCEGMVALRCNSWDVLGGLVIVEEAGGLATDFIRDYGLKAPGGVIACAPAFKTSLEAASGLRL